MCHNDISSDVKQGGGGGIAPFPPMPPNHVAIGVIDGRKWFKLFYYLSSLMHLHMHPSCNLHPIPNSAGRMSGSPVGRLMFPNIHNDMGLSVISCCLPSCTKYGQKYAVFFQIRAKRQITAD